MGKVQITVGNFDYDKLSPDLKDSFDTFKEGLVEMLISEGKSVEELSQEKLVYNWLNQEKEAAYDEPSKDSSDIDALLSRYTPAPKPKKSDGEDSNKMKSGDVKDKQALLEEKLKKEEEAIAKKKKDEELAKQQAEEEAAKKEAETNSKEAAEAAAKKHLEDLAAKLAENPISKVKVKELEEYKGKDDVGFQAAVDKLKLAQSKDISGLSKVLKSRRAGEINFDVIHWDSVEGELILSICWYVCVNGPVGVGKKTRFGSIPGEICIRDVFFDMGYPEMVTNSMWKKFCKRMVDYIDVKAPEVTTGRMMQIYGKLWPHCDPDMVSQKEFKEKRKEKFMEEHASVFEDAM